MACLLNKSSDCFLGTAITKAAVAAFNLTHCTSPLPVSCIESAITTDGKIAFALGITQIGVAVGLEVFRHYCPRY